MKITARCDKCNARFSVEDKFAGHKVKCPKCGGDFIVQQVNDNREPQKTPQSGPAPVENPPVAEGASDYYSLAAPELARCPNCQKTLAPKAVLCVDCGFDLRTGTKLQSHGGQEKPKGGAAKTLKRQSNEEPSPRVRKKPGGGAKIKPLAKVGAVLLIVAASVGCIWGAMTLYDHMKNKLNENEAFVRLDFILGEKPVSAKKFAQELPYVFAYLQQLPKTQPKYVEIKNGLFLKNIHLIPKDTDFTPLLEFPPDSLAYEPIFDLLKKNTDLSWRMQKSCNSSETARHYGADLLMAALPFISWSESDKNSLREKTDVEEKQRRFRKYAEQSQLAAEKRLPGRYFLHIEATYAASKEQPGEITAETGKRIAKTASPVIEAINKTDKSWKVSFFGRSWTGPIEQFTQIDLSCPMKEHQDLIKNLPFNDQLQQAQLHLRFKDDKFAVDLEQLPDPQYMSENELRYIARIGFTGFQCKVLKAVAQSPIPNP